MWAGLLLMIATGFTLLMRAPTFYLTEPVFYAKIGFVLVLVMNSFAIGKLSEKAALTPFAQLSSQEKKTLLVSGALSFSGWVAAAGIGYFIL